MAGQGKGIEHVSQHSPGWPPHCHNLPGFASQVLDHKQYELDVAQDLRDPHSILHTVLGCGVLGKGLGESLMTGDPQKQNVSFSSRGWEQVLHKKVKPGFPGRLQGAFCQQVIDSLFFLLKQKGTHHLGLFRRGSADTAPCGPYLPHCQELQKM